MTDNERNMQQQIEELEKKLKRVMVPVQKLVQAVNDKAAVQVTLKHEDPCVDRAGQLREQFLGAELMFQEAVLEQIDVVREML